MDQIGQDQHVDVTAEVGQRVGQGLAVLATLGEAVARVGAEEQRRRERIESQTDNQEHADRRRQDAAAQLAEAGDRPAQHAASQRARHDRRVMAQGTDSDWLARADLFDLATVWRTARIREEEFPEARGAAETVEQRLRDIYPRPMDLYDEAIRRGVPRADAMRAAAQEMAQTPVMRPHGGGRAGGLPPGEDATFGTAAFREVVSDEQIQQATGVNAAVYSEQLQRLGVGGEAAAQALREALPHGPAGR